MQQAWDEELPPSHGDFGLHDLSPQCTCQPIRRILGGVDVHQPAAQGRLLGDDGASESPQRRIHRVDRLAGLGRDCPLGDDPQTAGKIELLLGQRGLRGGEQSADFGFQPRRQLVGGNVHTRLTGTAPDDPDDGLAARSGVGERLLPGVAIGGGIDPDSSRLLRRQLVETGDQPGSVCGLGLVVGIRTARRRGLMPAQGVEQSGRVATEAAQQRLAGCALDREFADAAQALAVAVKEVDVEDVGFPVDPAAMPTCPAVEPPGHALPQLDLPVAQRQEQIRHPVLDGQQRRECREGHAGAQIEQHRVDRLAAEMFGQFVADGDVADRFAVTDPQRFQRTRPGRAPGQFHVVEGFEQLLGIGPRQPFDRLVDRIGRRRRPRVGHVGTFEHGAVGVQRPVGVANSIGTAVDGELPAVRRLQWSHGELNLTGCLLGQDDRFVEEHFLHPRRCSCGRQRHGCVGRSRDDHRAVDDVVSQPRLGLDRHDGAVDGVAGGEILCAPEDSGCGRAVGSDSRGLGPEAASLERIGRQLQSAPRCMAPGAEVGPLAVDVGGGERFGHLPRRVGALAQ